MKTILIYTFWSLCIFSYRQSNAKAPAHKHAKRYSQKTKFTSISKHLLEVDIDYTFPKGYNLEMNSQLLQASISEDPYTEYEQVIDQIRPATLVEFGFVINIKGWKK